MAKKKERTYKQKRQDIVWLLEGAKGNLLHVLNKEEVTRFEAAELQRVILELEAYLINFKK